MKRKMIVSIMVIVLLAAVPVYATNSQSFPLVDIFVEGACEGQSCGKGMVMNGTTYVPIRLVSESLGAAVVWNQQEQTVTVLNREKEAKGNNEDPQTVDPYHLEVLHLMEEIQYALEMNQVYLEQLSVAKELFDETGKKDMVSPLQQDKIKRLTDLNQSLAEQYTAFNERHKNRQNENAKLFAVMAELNLLTSSLNSATLALDRHIHFSTQPELEIYIYEKKMALDRIESIISGLKKLKAE